MTTTFTAFDYEFPEQAAIQLNLFDNQDGDQTRLDFTIHLPYLTEHFTIYPGGDNSTDIHVVMRGSWEAAALLESMEHFCRQLRAAKISTTGERREALHQHSQTPGGQAAAQASRRLVDKLLSF